jgi:hypothetical protein
MRTLISSLVVAATLGVFGLAPAEAQAQRFRRPAVTTYYYNYTPNFNAYPWNYWAATGQYSLTPGYYGYNDYYPYYSPLYAPSLNYSYTLPSYQYYYGPGYARYYYSPGSYYYWLR